MNYSDFMTSNILTFACIDQSIRAGFWLSMKSRSACWRVIFTKPQTFSLTFKNFLLVSLTKLQLGAMIWSWFGFNQTWVHLDDHFWKEFKDKLVLIHQCTQIPDCFHTVSTEQKVSKICTISNLCLYLSWKLIHVHSPLVKITWCNAWMLYEKMVCFNFDVILTSERNNFFKTWCEVLP